MRIFILVILLCFSVVSEAKIWLNTKGIWYDAVPNAGGDHEGKGIHIDNNTHYYGHEKGGSSTVHWGEPASTEKDSSYNFTRGYAENLSLQIILKTELLLKSASLNT